VDLKDEGITVFTPKGDSIELPEGSTVLDFAFAIHTQLGLHCVGARINNDVISATRTVTNGATIQILTSHNQNPLPEWLEIVRTEKAKQELRRWMRTSIVKEAQTLGKELWMRELRIFKITKAEEQPKTEEICTFFGVKTIEEFYDKLGQGEMALSELEKFIQKIHPEKFSEADPASPVKLFVTDQADESQLPVEVGNESSLLIHFANCCSPIPGEPIIGALIPKHGIEIHREGCPLLQSIPESRRIAMEWNRDSKKEFSVHLKIDTDDRKGITTDIMDATAKAKVFIERMSVVSGKKSGRVRLVFRIARRDMLEHLMEEIRKISGVREVCRL
jgi:GTP pyrophosphokinase